MTMEVNVQEDLNAVNDQLAKLVEELNKVSSARENLIQQVQNLNGVSMYLRGKLPSEEQGANTLTESGIESEKEFERDNIYPPDNA